MTTTDLKRLPARPSLEHYKKQAKELVKAAKLKGSPIILANAQLVVARQHGFESWPKFAKHVAALNRTNSTVSRFEMAADAVVAGDLQTLESLLLGTPNLIRSRSTRVHRATLLHYLGANGVEDFRQKSPSDAVAVANMLLEARAEVDALADIYGKSTTLGLVATSIHPRRAGVQIALMETLLEHGAAMDGIVVPALHNGRKEAAEFLARRGAKLDLEGAAGVGRLDLVQQFVEQGATKAAMELGFLWACEYGRTDVVEYLLAKGVDIDTQANTGMTGLHWAIVGGDLEIIKLLVARGARLDILNRYGGTALGQALWSAEHGESDSDYQSVINLLLGHGANS